MKTIRALFRFCVDDIGVASIYMLCLLPVFLMILGLGMDGAAAFRTQNLLQSTADASALAAALQLPTSGSASTTQKSAAVTQATTYATANMSVAGFGNVLHPNPDVNGDLAFGNWNGTTFTTPAASGASENAVRVTVKTATANGNPYPTSFLAFIGKSSWDIGASATARIGVPVPVCLQANGVISISGSASVNLGGCTIESVGDMTCNLSSSATQPAYGLAGGWDGPNGSHTNYCGSKGHFSHVDTSSFTDPYSGLQASIPSFSCTPGATLSWNVTAAPGNYCGNVKLAGPVTVTGGPVVISNGSLDTNGFPLTVTNGTIIFTGSNSASYNHNIVDTSNGSGIGSITITPPNSGTWSGIAMFQDRTLNMGIDIPIANAKMPDLSVTGVIYTRFANWNYKGSMNSGGSSCLVLVANDINVVGQGSIFAQQACAGSPPALLPISQLVQ